MMKPWMKALVWLGLGGGIGFFSGYRLGCIQREKEMANDWNLDEIKKEYEKQLKTVRDESIKAAEHQRDIYEKALDAVRQYKGEDEMIMSAGQIAMDISGDFDGDEMVMEPPPEIPDIDLPEGEEEIQPLHPEDLLPHAISRDEYVRNEKGYDKIQLDWYTEDNAVFDPREEEKWTHPEQLLGIGWNSLFIGRSGKLDVPEVYIMNDTMEAIYKITRIDDSFERLYEEE